MLESIKVTGNVTLCNNCRDWRLHCVTIVLVTYNDVSSDANFYNYIILLLHFYSYNFFGGKPSLQF